MGFDELSTESRMIATPWSRMVRGIGLGQYPVDYDPEIAGWIRHSLDLVAERAKGDSYTAFARRTAGLILTVAGGDRIDLAREVEAVADEVRAVKNPYYRVTAGSVLMDAVAKLGVGSALPAGFPAEILATVDRIEPDRIKDENSGRHGDYEKLSAFTAVFLAHGQLGLADRLGSLVPQALGLLDNVPAPFFRGRGGAMLISVISLIGHGAHLAGEERDHVAAVLDYLDRADELRLAPSFPQPMSPAFATIYPLVTMLNAIAMTGRPEYLTHGRDRLAQMRELWAAITPVERTHMGLYYLVALHNLGRLRAEVPDLDGFVEALVGQWRHVDPGENFFLNGISYAYMIETAMIAGRPDLITGAFVERLVDSFPDLDRTELDRANRPYPFSYAVNALGEIGAAARLFTPRARYGARTPMEWVVGQLSGDLAEENSRLYMLNHALISYALRLRGAGSGETELFRSFRFGAR
ncbi:hypothetical protein [Actinoplanes sp. NPDC049681]|uniref:hypothetical protein n=1 Tax=Actinoplanes sp. NPDC049681 TaxID=3363905 RepID=UPI0037AACE14